MAIVTLLVINISGEVAEAHGSEHHSNSTEAMSTTGVAATPSIYIRLIYSTLQPLSALVWRLGC
ncbi:MAG: hypothetical protein V7K21_10925 [Nostoc sp.]